MMDGILMGVGQPREVRAFVSQPRLAKVVPDLVSGSVVQRVYPFCSLLMQSAEHPGKALRVRFAFGCMGHKMVMVRKHRPRFQLPAEVARDGKQASMQHFQ